MRPASGALLLRAAAAVARGEGEGAPPGPPLPWTGEGSRALRFLGAARARAGGRLDALLDALAAPCDRLARRPVPVLAACIAAVPLARVLLGSGSGPLVASLLLLGAMAALASAGSALHTGRERRWVLAALLAGLLLRLAAGGAVAAMGGFPDEDHLYHPLARDAAAAWSAGVPSDLAAHPVVRNRAAYYHLLAATYLAGGAEVPLGRALGAALGLLAALLAGEAARPLGGPRAAALAVAILALHPEHAFWSATLSRDTLSTVLVLLALAILARRPGALFRGGFLAVAPPLALLALNSFLLAGVLAAVVAILALAEGVAGAAAGRARGWTALAAALLLGGAALLWVGHHWGAYFSPGLLTAVRRDTIGNAPDFLPGLAFDGLLPVLLFLPLGVLFVLLAPWPWTPAGAKGLYAWAALPGLAVTALGIVGLAASLRRRPAATAPLVLFLALALSLLGLLETNTGIVVRHRLPLTAVLAAGAGVLLAGLQPRRSA